MTLLRFGDDHGRFVFCPFAVAPDDRLRAERLGATIVDDVRLEWSPDVNEWAEGEAYPDDVLGRSIADPSRYRAFRYRSEIDGSGFRPVGHEYSVLGEARQLPEFLGNLANLERIASIVDEADTPDGAARQPLVGLLPESGRLHHKSRSE